MNARPPMGPPNACGATFWKVFVLTVVPASRTSRRWSKGAVRRFHGCESDRTLELKRQGEPGQARGDGLPAPIPVLQMPLRDEHECRRVEIARLLVVEERVREKWPQAM